MKQLSKVKLFVMILIILSFVLNLTIVSAGNSLGYGTKSPANSSNISYRLSNLLDFKFYNKEHGIGYGYCPVYTAPSEYAYRLADGKAGCDTNSYMSEAGYDVTGWLMVRYDTNKGGTRVGYIPPSYVKGYKARITRLEFDYIPVRASGSIYITDNPLDKTSAFAILSDGEEFYVLAQYTYFGNWWYIECTVDGQTARGFIDKNSSSFTY